MLHGPRTRGALLLTAGVGLVLLAVTGPLTILYWAAWGSIVLLAISSPFLTLVVFGFAAAVGYVGVRLIGVGARLTGFGSMRRATAARRPFSFSEDQVND